MMSAITTDELTALCDFAGLTARVNDPLCAALPDAEQRLRFFGRYASWNGFFGSGVATLSGKIGRAHGLFRDAAEPIDALADRSVFVASFVFDAARDEFDDHETVYRDTHRDLAQAFISGLIHFVHAGPHAAGFSERDPQFERLNQLLAEPEWLRTLNAHVATGYGAFLPDIHASLFQAIGYHLGSELLADREFSLIDRTLRQKLPQLVEFLRGHRETIGGHDHCAYQWIAIHSGDGGAVEEDHFAKAIEGANLALYYTPAELHVELRERLHDGFRLFDSDHRTFFSNVNRP
jgi:hypothetical protein